MKDGGEYHHSSDRTNSFKYLISVLYLDELNGGFTHFSAGHNVDDVHIHKEYLMSLK
jgi:hypothetical protein